MKFLQLANVINPYLSIIRWVIGIGSGMIIVTWSFFTIKTDYIDRLTTIEKGQVNQMLVLEEIKKDIQLDKDNTTTLFRHFYERIEADLDKQTKETNRKLELIIKYREMDKELLIDMLSLSRAMQTPMVVKRDSFDLDLKIGIKQKLK